MRGIRWWQYGVLGAVVLSLATLHNLRSPTAAVRLIVRAASGEVSWADAGRFAAAIGGMGFVCGVVAWAGRCLPRRLGSLGDALLGMAVMVVYFACCMLLFDPALLAANWTGGLLLLGLAAVLGLIGGFSLGRDIRTEGAQDQRQ